MIFTPYGLPEMDDAYLAPTYFLDSDDPVVVDFARRAAGDETDPTVIAVKLFYAVRDEFRYDPFAIWLAPDPTLIHVLLGQALISANDPALAEEAISSLRKALANDSEIPDAYEHLAIAYGRKGDLADADLASAQAAFNRGNLPTARQLASRAKGRFPIGSPGWVKADDIASFKPPQPRRLIQ